MIDVFRVGVHIGMTTNSSQILSVMLRELTGIHLAASKVEGALGKIRGAVLAAGAAFVGWEALKVMTKLTEKGIAFNQQLAQMKMANYAPSDIGAIETQASKTMLSVPGSNLIDNIKNLIDLRNISGSAEHATALSDLIARTNLVLANVSGKPAEQEGYKFAKFLEDSGRMMDPKTGQFSEARVEQQGRWMQAVIAAMNARVTGGDLFQLRQSGKASVNMLSDEGLTNLLPFIQSLGANAVGTALQGGNQQLLGGVQLSKHTIQWLEHLDLMDPTKVHQAKGGRFTLDPGALHGEQQFRTDRAGWVWDVLEKAMGAKGLSKEQMVQEIGRSGLRTPLLGFIAEAIQNEFSQRKEIGNVKRAQGVDTFKKMDEESPTFRITKFTEAWENLQVALGKTVDVTVFLIPLTNALNGLIAEITKHPEIAKGLIELAAGVAAITALGGGIKLFSIAAPAFAKGLGLITGIEGLGAAGTGLSAIAGGLGALIRPITAIMAILKVGSDNETPENREKLEVLRKQRGSGLMPEPLDGNGPFGPDGKALSPPTGAPEKHSSIQGDVYLDGSKIGRWMQANLASSIARPPAGPTDFNPRTSAPWPSLA